MNENLQFGKLINDFKARSIDDNSFFEHLRNHINGYEHEKEGLLALSDDITKVRDKTDLIRVFSSRLKGLFYFTHAVVSLIDTKGCTYFPFLIDRDALKISHREELPRLLATRFPLEDPFIDRVKGSDDPVSFLLDDIMQKSGVPDFIKVNYECGIRRAMIAPLKSRMERIGFVFVYSDRTDEFPDEFRGVLKRIAPQLSSAVSNIITNEEISYKEWVNEVLLQVSNSLATVRRSKDLLPAVNEGLRKVVNFTHNLLTRTDEEGEHYRVYLTDPETPALEYPKYEAAAAMANPVSDGIYNLTAPDGKPTVFDMTRFDLDKVPLWVKLNYIAGSREMVINILPDKGKSQLGLILFAQKPGSFNEGALHILERISSQLATAVTNIAMNEEILIKEKQNSFLLALSHEIAAVRSKDDLARAIEKAVKRLSSVKGYVVRLINDDNSTTRPYIWDSTIPFKDDPIFIENLTINFNIKDGIQDKVLKNTEPTLIITAEEMKRSTVPRYVRFWDSVGFEKMIGVPLRTGTRDLGILFMETDEVNLPLLKGICAQISIAISNVIVNEQLFSYKKMLEVENDQLKEQINTIYNATDMIGNGTEMRKIYHLMSIVAKSNSTVLILGETGTGKELVARGIHKESNRKDKLMVKVNCAALPANLIESELFGHEKGAFTGAIERRIGKFELAHNSTLFLDEIGEMPLDLQVKLLRVIQEREFERIGGKNTIKVDVRIIAATNRNLEEEVNAGRFRADLYYRLNVFPINVPPLRQRLEDIPTLAYFFLARHSKNTGIKVTSIANKVLQELKGYSWPGNVRELEHLLERSVLMTTDHVVREVYLPKRSAGSALFNNRTLDEMERQHIIETLRSCAGKIAGDGGAAGILGTPSTTLHAKMKRLKIAKTDYLPNAN